MIVIKSGRNPLAVSLLGFCAFSGLGSIATYKRSASNVIRSLPEPMGYIFYAVLALASLLALVGIFKSGVIGPLLERAGLCALAGLFAAYGGTVFTLAGLRAIMVAMILVGLAVGFTWRVVQIGRELNMLHAAAERVGALEELGGTGELARDSAGQRRPGDECGDAVHDPTTGPEVVDGKRQDEG